MLSKDSVGWLDRMEVAPAFYQLSASLQVFLIPYERKICKKNTNSIAQRFAKNYVITNATPNFSQQFEATSTDTELGMAYVRR